MELLHATARTSVQWMLYCLLEGTLLVAFTWIVLRLLPRQNSGTRFALWFSALGATVLLPFLAGTFFREATTQAFASSVTPRHSLLIVPDYVALAIFSVWGLLSTASLSRVSYAVWQVNRIRRNSQPVDLSRVDPTVKAIIESSPRAVTLCVSDAVRVPAAIGFFKPAVVVPRWALDEIPPAELRQILLHELTHLRRRDDWTNLAQQLAKAVMFFHPLVWWLEQKLSLEREMACDEAVLARSDGPYQYAECLARLAEKTWVKQKIAMVQGIVGRMRQLSLRVTQILDTGRPTTTRIWKPAVPVVAIAAVLCGFSAWSAPALISFRSDAYALPVAGTASAPVVAAQVNTSLRSNVAQPSNAAQPRMILAGASLNSVAPSQPAAHRIFHKRPLPKPNGDYVVRAEQVILTMTPEPGTGQPMMWHVSMWQVRILAPSGNHAGKAVPRKNI